MFFLPSLNQYRASKVPAKFHRLDCASICAIGKSFAFGLNGFRKFFRRTSETRLFVRIWKTEPPLIMRPRLPTLRREATVRRFGSFRGRDLFGCRLDGRRDLSAFAPRVVAFQKGFHVSVEHWSYVEGQELREEQSSYHCHT